MRTLPRFLTALIAWILFLLAVPSAALAQPCAFDWSSDFDAGDFDGDVIALAVHDPGPGARLYAGGGFLTAGGVPANRVAQLIDGQWVKLDDGVSGAVSDLLSFDDGSGQALYVTGSFQIASGVSARGIARWDGRSWSTVGGSADAGAGQCMAIFDDGNGPALYVGGTFTSIGGVTASRIARWDGSSWTALGAGCDGTVWSLAVADLGSGPKLYAGGFFTNAGGAPANRVACWDGTTWSALGSGADGAVQAMAAFDDGNGTDLYVGGLFQNVGGVSSPYVARWDGTSFSTVGAGTGVRLLDLLAHDDGSGPALYAAHTPIEDKIGRFGMQRFDGSIWARVGGGPNNGTGVFTVFDDGGGDGAKLYVGGYFTSVGGTPASGLASWDGSTWSAVSNEDVGMGLSGQADAFLAADVGGTGRRLYAIGYFSDAGGTEVNRIASWDGSTWSALGDGLDDAGHALELFDDGGGEALYVGGRFDTAGGVASPAIAKWDGISWSDVGGGLGTVPTVHDLEVFDDGGGEKLYATGFFIQAGGAPASRIACWDGVAWSEVGGGLDLDARALIVFDDGGGADLYVAGRFTTAGGVPARGIARWDGVAWTSVGGSLDSGEAESLIVFDDGNGPALYMGGNFTSVGGQSIQYLAKWDGSSWSQVPDVTGRVRELAVLDEGHGDRLMAMSNAPFANGVSGSIARWNGFYWESLGAGLNASVAGGLATVDPDGAGPDRPELWVGGNFLTAGGVSSGRVARWHFTRRPDQYVRLDFGEVGVPVSKSTNEVFREDGSVLMTLDKGARAGFDPEELGFAVGTNRNHMIRDIIRMVRADFITEDGRRLDVCFGKDAPDFSPYTTVKIVSGTYPDMVVSNSVPATEVRVEAATARLALTGGNAAGYFVMIEDGLLRRPDNSLVPGISFPELRRIRVDAFGSAQMLDKGNVDKNKSAWVFVGEHALSGDPNDNLRELINSVSHEVSHLLGLEHADGEDDSILGVLDSFGTDKGFSATAREKLAELLPPGGGGGTGLRGIGLRTRQDKIGDSDQYGTNDPGVLSGLPDADAAAIMREARLLLEPQATHESEFEFDLMDVMQADVEDGPFTDIALTNGSIITYSLDLGSPGIDHSFNGAFVELAILNVADVLGGPDDFKVLVDGVELIGALDGIDQRISDPDFAGYSCGERVTFFLPDYMSIPQIEAAMADGMLDVTLEVRGDTSFVVVDSVLAIVTDGAGDAIRECGFGTVNLGGGKRADVLTINDNIGGEFRTVVVEGGDSIAARIDLPPAGGAGRFVVHLDAGAPIESGVTTLPSGLGTSCFPFLMSGASPVAVWTNMGAGGLAALGGNDYFGGSSPGTGTGGLTSTPPPAPITFLNLPDGDLVNLPVGTTVTFQGLIDDPNSQSSYGMSATNAVVLKVE